MTSIFGLLVAYRVRYRWLWLLALAAGSEPFLYRMSMTRAPSLSLVLLAVGVYLILERRWVSLAVLTFVFVWLYNMFPLIVAFAFVYAVTVWLSEKPHRSRRLLCHVDWGGPGAGHQSLFPQGSLAYFSPRAYVARRNGHHRRGQRVVSLDTWELVTKNAALLALCFAALLAFDFRILDFRKGARDRRPLFFLLLSGMFLLMSLRWRRFLEYWPPFAMLFAAFTFHGDGTDDAGGAQERMTQNGAEPIELPRCIPARLGMAVLWLRSAWQAS